MNVSGTSFNSNPNMPWTWKKPFIYLQRNCVPYDIFWGYHRSVQHYCTLIYFKFWHISSFFFFWTIVCRMRRLFLFSFETGKMWANTFSLRTEKINSSEPAHRRVGRSFLFSAETGKTGKTVSLRTEKINSSETLSFSFSVETGKMWAKTVSLRT